MPYHFNRQNLQNATSKLPIEAFWRNFEKYRKLQKNENLENPRSVEIDIELMQSDLRCNPNRSHIDPKSKGQKLKFD